MNLDPAGRGLYDCIFNEDLELCEFSISIERYRSNDTTFQLIGQFHRLDK